MGRVVAVVGAAVLALSVVPAPSATSTGASLTAIANSAWQTDASVLGLAVAKGKAYVGGRFTKVRPPGAAAGDQSDRSRPKVTLTDTSAPSGTSQMYRIEVTDGQNTVRGGYSTITVR